MKKVFNYSFLILLFSFLSFACSKESDEVAPSASLQSESVDNTKYCPPPIEVCAYSQGRYFNRGNGGKHWPAGVNTVMVGGVTLTRGEDTLPATTPERRALFQAATLILSAQEQGIAWNTYFNSLPADVRAAYNCIVTYYQNTNVAPTCNLQSAAGTIGDWIDENHCED